MTNAAEFKDVLARYVRARIPFISIRSSERKRAIELVQEVFAEAGTQLSASVHTLSQGFRDLQTGSLVADERSIVGALDFVGQQVATRQNVTYVFTDVQDLGSDTPTARQFYDVVSLAEQRGGCLMVVTSDPVWPALQRMGMSLELMPPDADEMESIVRGFLGEYAGSIPIEWIDDDYRQAATRLAGISRMEAENAIATLVAKHQVRREDLNELTRIKDRIFSDISGIERVAVTESELQVGGLGELRRWLDRQREFLTADLRDRHLPPPRGVLLVGVPGCGKSLSAKAIAAGWDLPLYRLDMGSILGMYVGQSEGRLREALETADHVAPCVLWIDEIEKGLAGGMGGDSTGITTRLIGQFLYWLQESKKRVFVVATANDVKQLPGELLRKGRFDEIFFVDLPTADERREIISIYLARYLRAALPAETLEEMVTLSDGFAGADIDAAVREIGREAYRVGDANVPAEFALLAFRNTVPLSKTNPERIEEVRAWGRERAVPASGHPIGERLPGDSRRVVLA